MIQLPPGCTVAYEIRIVVDEVSPKISEWFLLQDGRAWNDEYINHRGKNTMIPRVQYGKGKPSHTAPQTKETLIRFNGTDASLATLFLLKFCDNIINHNMEETMRRYEQDNIGN